MKRINPGDIISYTEMCVQENGYSLQRGMNFRVKGSSDTVILMSLRKGAPYADRLENNGATLIYEGHDVPKNVAKIPKTVDQQQFTPTGKPTQNGKFYQAAVDYKEGSKPAELVKVYEKIKDGIWVFNGIFELHDAWVEKSGKRKVFKFQLQITDRKNNKKKSQPTVIDDIEHNRMIPTAVKLEVWKRDGGKCRQCGKTDNLHFDHILPFSKGGTSLKADNIQLLCARHNLKKSNSIS